MISYNFGLLEYVIIFVNVESGLLVPAMNTATIERLWQPQRLPLQLLWRGHTTLFAKHADMEPLVDKIKRSSVTPLAK